MLKPAWSILVSLSHLSSPDVQHSDVSLLFSTPTRARLSGPISSLFWQLGHENESKSKH